MTPRLPSRARTCLAECGYCTLEGPDSFGQNDLIVNPACPYHAGDPYDALQDYRAENGWLSRDEALRELGWTKETA